LVRLAFRCVPLLLGVLVYSNAIDGSFHFDDGHAVADNPSIRALSNIPNFFTDAGTFSVLPQNQGYRPLLLVSYALTAALTGVEPSAFVAVNLTVHVICVLLFQTLLRKVLRLLGHDEDERLIAISSAIFAVHPIFSECVNYVSARSESLCAVFSLLAMIAYLRDREGGARGWLPAAAGAMGCAMLVKAVAISVPALVFVLELGAARRQPPRLVTRRLLWLLVPAVAGLVLVGQMTPEFAVQSASGFSRSRYFIASLPAILHYLALFLWPLEQSADPGYRVAQGFFDPHVLLATLVLAAGLVFVVRSITLRRNAWVGVGLAWFLICILPSQSVFPLAEIVNEHRPYLAAAGLCPLLAAALLHGSARLFAIEGRMRLHVAGVATALALGLLAMLTVTRNQVWASDLTLWEDVAAGAPRSTRAQMNYGRALMAAGKLTEAEHPLREAVRLGPLYAYAHINLGVWMMARGKLEEAKGLLDRAVQLSPQLIHAHMHRGKLAERLNEAPSVREWYFRRAAELSPNLVDAQYHLASALMAGKKAAEAEAPARKAVELRNQYKDRFILSWVLLELGKASEAEPILLGMQREQATDQKVAYNLSYARKLLAKD
jgi:protein O-mannosyl-transferase